jgi:hypothetical protein
MIPLVLEMLASSGQGLGPSIVIGMDDAPPYIKVFYDTGDEPYTENTNFISQSPGAAVQALQPSPVGDVIAVGINVSPFIVFYDNGTKLANPSSLPSFGGFDIAWTQNGSHCAYAASGMHIYKRSGGTFAKLSSPFDVAPPANSARCAFSDDGIYLAVWALSTSPYITWYKRSADTFTKLAQTSGGIPAGAVQAVSWAPSGAYLAVTYTGSPYLKIYKRTGDTLSATSVTFTAIPSSNSGKGLAWSADGNYLVVGADSAPYFVVLKRSGDTFTKLADPAAAHDFSVDVISFSGSDRFAIQGKFDAVKMYSIESDVVTNIGATGLPTVDAKRISFYPPAVPGSS